MCNDAGPQNLFNSLGGTPQAGGSWTGPGGGAHSGVLDPAVGPAGTYTYTVQHPEHGEIGTYTNTIRQNGDTVTVDTKVLITDDPAEKAAGEQQVREHLALYIGGMGARGKNFYNDLAGRFGFSDAAREIQDLFLAGKRTEAAAAVPAGLVEGVALVGSPGWVAERVTAFAAAGVTTINATPLATTHEHRVKDIASLKEYAS